MTVRGLKSLLLAHNKSEDSWDVFLIGLLISILFFIFYKMCTRNGVPPKDHLKHPYVSCLPFNLLYRKERDNAATSLFSFILCFSSRSWLQLPLYTSLLKRFERSF